MTGPERFARAVELLEQSRGQSYSATGTVLREEAMIQASLAAAAATIEAARLQLLIESPSETAQRTARAVLSRWLRVTEPTEDTPT